MHGGKLAGRMGNLDATREYVDLIVLISFSTAGCPHLAAENVGRFLTSLADQGHGAC